MDQAQVTLESQVIKVMVISQFLMILELNASVHRVLQGHNFVGRFLGAHPLFREGLQDHTRDPVISIFTQNQSTEVLRLQVKLTIE